MVIPVPAIIVPKYSPKTLFPRIAGLFIHMLKSEEYTNTSLSASDGVAISTSLMESSDLSSPV